MLSTIQKCGPISTEILKEVIDWKKLILKQKFFVVLFSTLASPFYCALIGFLNPRYHHKIWIFESYILSQENFLAEQQIYVCKRNEIMLPCNLMCLSI